jgi:hypothetical protein
MSFSDIDYDLFNTILECCKKNADIKYADRQRHNIVGRSVFGTQTNLESIFKLFLKKIQRKLRYMIIQNEDSIESLLTAFSICFYQLSERMPT